MSGCNHGERVSQGAVKCGRRGLVVHRGVCRACPDFRGPWPEFLAVLDKIQAKPCKQQEGRA